MDVSHPPEVTYFRRVTAHFAAINSYCRVKTPLSHDELFWRKGDPPTARSERRIGPVINQIIRYRARPPPFFFSLLTGPASSHYSDRLETGPYLCPRQPGSLAPCVYCETFRSRRSRPAIRVSGRGAGVRLFLCPGSSPNHEFIDQA